MTPSADFEEWRVQRMVEGTSKSAVEWARLAYAAGRASREGEIQAKSAVVEAAGLWAAETGPGMRVNTAMGRSETVKALAALNTLEGSK